MDRTYRVERGRRAMFLGFAGVSALLGIGAMIGSIQEGRLQPILVAAAVWFVGLAAWTIGMASMQIVTDASGVDLRNALFWHEKVSWSDIDRFEIAERGHLAVLVRRDEHRIPLIGYAISPLERWRGQGSPATTLVQELNDELELRRGGPRAH